MLKGHQTLHAQYGRPRQGSSTTGSKRKRPKEDAKEHAAQDKRVKNEPCTHEAVVWVEEQQQEQLLHHAQGMALDQGDGWVRIETAIVGIRFRKQHGADLQSCRLGLRPEPTNRMDPSAVQVVAEGDAAAVASAHLHIGYLPRQVAQHLHKPLRQGAIQIQAAKPPPSSPGSGSGLDSGSGPSHSPPPNPVTEPTVQRPPTVLKLVLLARHHPAQSTAAATAATAPPGSGRAGTGAATAAATALPGAGSAEIAEATAEATAAPVAGSAETAPATAAATAAPGAGSAETAAAATAATASPGVGSPGSCQPQPPSQHHSPSRHVGGEAPQQHTGGAALCSPQRGAAAHTVRGALVRAADAATAWWQARDNGAAGGEVLRKQFVHMVSEARRLDGHLFTAEEHALLGACLGLPQGAQRLLLRLFVRKGPWFALRKLAYPECGDVDEAAAALVDARVALRPGAAAEAWDVAGLLPAPQLQAVVGSALAAGQGPQRAAKPPTKAAAMAWLGENAAGGAAACRAYAQVLDALGPCIRLAPAAVAVIQRLQLVCFLEPQQGLSSCLAAERGVTRYPTYRVNRTTSAFASRQQLLDYEEALQQAAQLDALLQSQRSSGLQQAEPLMAPALEAVRTGAHRRVRWAGDATIPGGVPLLKTLLVGLLAPAAAAAAAGGGGSAAPPAAFAAAGGAAAPPVEAPARAAGLASAGGGGGRPACDQVDLTFSSSSDEEGGDVGAAGCRAAGLGGSCALGGSSCGPPPAAAADPDGHHDGGGLCNMALVPSQDDPFGQGRSSQLGDGASRDVCEWSCGDGHDDHHTGRSGRTRDAPLSAVDNFEEEEEGCCTEAADAADPHDPDEERYEDDIAYGDEEGEAVLGFSCHNLAADDAPLTQQPTPAMAAAAAMAPPHGACCPGACACACSGATAALRPSAAAAARICCAGDGNIVAAVAPCMAACGAQLEAAHCLNQGAPVGYPRLRDEGGDQAQGRQSAAAAPQFLARFCSAWVHTTIATMATDLLERERRYCEAARLLAQLLQGRCAPGRRGYWWLRLSLDLAHMHRVDEALQVAEAGLADPWVRHGDRLALQHRVLWLGRPPRRFRRPSWAATLPPAPRTVVIKGHLLAGSKKPGARSVFVAPDGSHVSVEELALLHYASAQGGAWRGLHAEGSVWTTLWGLLMWDATFDGGVPEVLRTPFQAAPLDLHTDAFYPARRAALDGLLVRIANGEAPEMLAAAWGAHRGVWAAGVSWELLQLEELQDIARCVGGLGLSMLCRVLCEDAGCYGGGMPDLLLWRPERLNAMLVEVKGPRDRLSERQTAWLAVLAAAGLSAEVLKVREAPAPSGSSQHARAGQVRQDAEAVVIDD